MGPLNNAGVAEKMDEHVADALERGAQRRERRRARRRLPDRPLLAGDGARRRAAPTRSSRSEETFGPVAPVVAIDSLEQAIELANASPYGLLSAIFTRDLAQGPALRRRGAHRLGEHQRVVELLGERTCRSAAAPARASGIGRVGGTAPMESFTELQTVVVGVSLRLRHRRRRLRRLRAREPAERGPSTRVLVLEAGRPDYAVGPVHPHAGGALVPDRQPLYDWMYESEPEPFMHGRRDLPRARQGARRVELDQRDDLPARQPARLRALGRRAGLEELGLRALPAVLQADGDLPRRRRRVPRRRRAARRSSAAPATARSSTRSSRRCSRPATS